MNGTCEVFAQGFNYLLQKKKTIRLQEQSQARQIGQFLAK